MSKHQRYFTSAFTLFVFLFSGTALAEQSSSDGLWTEIKASSLAAKPQMPTMPATYRTLSLNQSALAALLARAPMEFTDKAKNTQVIITLPKPDGSFVRFRIEESPMLSPEIAAQVPDWTTYSGRGVDDPTVVVRFSWSATGLRAMVLERDGAYFVDPYSANDRGNYIAYFKRDLRSERRDFHCKLDNYFANKVQLPAQAADIDGITAPQFSNGTNLKTYKLAIATTGEYTVDRSGQANAFTDVMNAVNRINLVYRRDVSVSFTLVSGTNTVFPNPATDPYNNTDEEAQLAINQTQLDTIIGAANYDIGHLFGTGGGGVASSPSVCSSQKAEGYSARVPPTGDSFWVDYVAHEIGHQLSAQHTYNTDEDGTCSTRSTDDAYEVASGSTIMSYVGICSERNQQQFSLDNFHVRSLTQIIAELSSNPGGGTCGTTTPTSNKVPTVNPGATFTIPKQTPFTLTAAGTDADGDALTYSWEEYDLAPSASGPKGVPALVFDVDTDGVLRPLFRVYAPTTSPSRTYPSLPYILNNANVPPLTFTGTSPTGAACEAGETCVTGENLPSQMRTMNFRVVVRDNKGGTADAGTQVNVATSGPFAVTAPNTAITAMGGSALTVNWNVNNTTAAPVSAANVKISLSTNGGNTFSTTLLASTPNDGSAAVTLPNVSTTTARIKVEAVGNIFFDVSDANFTITGNGAVPGLVGNVSTRLPVGTDDDVLIEGFIVQGPVGSTKKIMVRALGPFLTQFGIMDALANPTLEIRGAGNAIIATNNDWETTQLGGIITGDQAAEIQGSGLAPANDLESAIIANLAPGNYTAVVRGVGNTIGTGIVDAYDMSAASPARLANVATRGLIQPGDKLMIAGFIIQNGPVRAVVRAIGPSLAQFNIANALPDTTLQLRDVNGAIVIENDDWQSNAQQKQELEATGLQPTNTKEAAVVATLQPGQYTAQVRGKPESTGIGVVEVYFLQ